MRTKTEIPAVTPLGLAAAFDPGLPDMALSIPALHGDTPWAYSPEPYTGADPTPCWKTFGEDPYLAGQMSYAAAARLKSRGTPLDPDSVDGIAGNVLAAGAVLLKNNRRTLPITGVYFKSVAVTGDGTDRVTGILNKIAPRVEWREVYGADVGAAEHCDAVVLCMNQSDGSDGALTEAQASLFDAYASLDKPLIVVVRALRPLYIDDVAERAGAILWLWQSGAFHDAVLARLLIGQINPSGRLPVTFPKGVEDGAAPLLGLPQWNKGGETYLNMRCEPLYPFGYGLSYTKFKYSRIRLSSERLPPGEGVTVTCNVANTGQSGGHEAAQLYLRHEDLNLTGMPRWRLCRVARLFLQPGESRELSFVLPGSIFSTVTGNNPGGVSPAGGRFVLYMGGHQPDARSAWLAETPVLSAFLTVEGENVCPQP